MRAAALLLLALVPASAACTYDVPGLADAGSDASSPSESGSHNGDAGDDAEAAAPETGPLPEGGAVDAACTGTLCACDNAGDCASSICGVETTVGSDLFAAAGGAFCTKPCCDSADCDDPGTVCFASGQGGNYCVDAKWLGRSSTLGAGIGGASCTAGSDCESGFCTGAHICADTCCTFPGTGGECAAGTQCAFGYFPGALQLDKHFTAFCGLPGGSGQFGDSCGGNGDCSGGLCFQDGSGGHCTQPCGSADECGGGNGCQLDQQGTDLYTACFPAYGTGDQGASCQNDDNCLGEWCGAGNQCTNVCYTDAACTVVGWHCLPESDDFGTGTYNVLICAKP